MLDATQPWLPLLDNEPATDPPIRRARRRSLDAPPVSALDPLHRAARQAFLGVAVSRVLTATKAQRLLGEPLSHEAERLERLDGILGAHRSLRLIAPEPAQCSARLRQPEPAFDGTSLLEVMLRDGLPGIAQVRAHLVARIPR